MFAVHVVSRSTDDNVIGWFVCALNKNKLASETDALSFSILSSVHVQKIWFVVSADPSNEHNCLI